MSTCFEIRRTPPDEKRQRKQEKEDEAKKEAETEYPLDLVPFGKICHVPFDNIKYGDSAVRTIIVRNPTSKNVNVCIEKFPKIEKGFEVDYAEFRIAPKEEAQLKIGWVPQNGTPLRENVYVKFGKLKTQMTLIGTCKLPQSMTQNQRKPLRPSSVQNLRKTQQQTIAPPKKILPPNPIVRQTNGSSPPVRPYSVPNEGKDHPHRALEVVQNSEQSWSPQPFRNSEVMEDARRDTFVVARKETFSEHSMASTASPRRETFIVPKSTNVHDESTVSRMELSIIPKATINHYNEPTYCRRETFVKSSKNNMLVTSTPRAPNMTENTRDGQTYALPSTVKKPNVSSKLKELSNFEESKNEMVQDQDDTIIAAEDEETTDYIPKLANHFVSEEKTEIIAKSDLPSSTNEVPMIVVEEFKDSKHLDYDENWLNSSAYNPSQTHLASVEAEVDSKLKRQGAIRRKDLENNFSENRPAGVFLSSENASFGAENPQNVNMEDEEANVVEPLKIKEIDLDDFKMDISDVDLNLSPEKKEISGLEIISNQSISIPPPPTRVNSNLKLSLSNGSRNSINDSTETYIIETDTIDVNLSLSPEKKEKQEHCEITGIENLSNNQSTRVNCNEKLSSSTETYVVDELQRSISLNDGTDGNNLTTSRNDDENLDLSHLSTDTYVKSPRPKLSKISEECEEDFMTESTSSTQEPEISSALKQPEVVVQCRVTAAQAQTSSSPVEGSDNSLQNQQQILTEIQSETLAEIQQPSPAESPKRHRTELVEVNQESEISLNLQQQEVECQMTAEASSNSPQSCGIEIPTSWEIPIVPKSANIHRSETFVKPTKSMLLTSTPRASSNIANENNAHQVQQTYALPSTVKKRSPNMTTKLNTNETFVKFSKNTVVKAPSLTRGQTVNTNLGRRSIDPTNPKAGTNTNPGRRSIDPTNAKTTQTSLKAKRRSVASSGPSSRLTLIKPTKSTGGLVSHPNPYAARNMYYDERWIEKQENGFKKWLNFVLTPPEDFETPGQLDVAKLWNACTKDVKVPRAPTREVLSMRAYTTRRELNTLRRHGCLLWQSPSMAQVVTKIETEIEKHRITIRTDRAVHRDLGMKKKMLMLLLNYNPLWLRIGLETVYGQIIPMDGTPTDALTLSRFILNQLLSNQDILAVYAHPTVPHHYRDGHEQALRKFTLKKILNLIYFLDKAKKLKIIKHNPCLFVKDSKIKMSKDVLAGLSRDFLSGEGDFIKHLAYLGYEVEHKQTALDEFDFAVTNIATDLKCGVRLCRIMEILTNETLTDKLRIPVISRLQNIHNVDLGLKALERSEAGMPPNTEISSKDIVNGHMEKTLGLLWHLIFGFQLGQILNEERLQKEISFLEKSLKFKAVNVKEEEAMNGFQFVGECKRQELQYDAMSHLQDKNDWAKSLKFKLLLEWARLVCAHYGLEVENLSTSFSDGRALCHLVHHYYPGFMPRSEIQTNTTQHQMKKQNLDSSMNDSFGQGMTYSYGQNGQHAELLANEKLNFKILHQKVQELGGVPMVIKSTEMSNTIPDQKVTATFLTYLAARLLDLSVEMQAARTIQFAWKKYINAKKEAALKVANKAAKIIQSKVRIFLKRRRFLRYNQAAVTIQAFFRGDRARKFVKQKKLEIRYKQHLKATIVIQKWIRRHLVFKRIKQQQLAALTIQNHWTGYQQRQIFLKTRQNVIMAQAQVRSFIERKRYEKILKSTVTIQTYVRGFLVRKRLEKQNTSVLKIQNYWRGYQQRKQFVNIRNQVTRVQAQIRMKLAKSKYQRLLIQRKNAAITIQKYVRKYRAIKLVENLRRIKAAVIVQKYWRRVLAKKKYQNILVQRENAATIIQKYTRKMIAIRETNILRQIKAVTTIQKNWRRIIVKRNYDIKIKAIIVIQSYIRGFIAKKLKNVLKEQKSAIIIQKWFRGYVKRKNFKMEIRCVITIQKFARGFLVRKSLEDQRISVLKIQNYWRGYQQRQKYLQICRNIVKVQAQIRMKLAIFSYEKLLLQRKNAAITIQKHVRKYNAIKLVVNLRRIKATVIIQKSWRCVMAKKKYHNLLLQRENAVIILQKHTRKMIAIKVTNHLRQIKAATTIQKYWRRVIAERNYEMKIKAIIVIQSHIRSFMAKKLRKFLKQQKSAVIIQKWFRGYTQRKIFELEMGSIITIQKFARGFLVRKNLEDQRTSALKIQTYWKGYKQRQEYLQICSHIVKIQAQIRMKSAMNSYQNKLAQRMNAAIIIQKHIRKFNAIKLVEKLRRIKAAVTIQKYWRGVLAKKKYQNLFLQREIAAIILQKYTRKIIAIRVTNDLRQIKAAKEQKYSIIIQKWYRGYIQRKKFKMKMSSIITIQTFTRGFLIRKCLEEQRISALKIQNYWRGYKQRQKYLQFRRNVVKMQAQIRMKLAINSYQNKLTQRKNAATTIQKYVRKYYAIKLVVNLRRIKAAVTIQKHWRCFLAKKKYHDILLLRENAAIVLQKHTRKIIAIQVTNNLRQIKAATTIQKHWRRVLAKKNYEIKIKAIIVIQSHIRSFIAKKLKKLLKEKKSAIIIQKWFRGYTQRKNFKMKMECIITIQKFVRGFLARKSLEVERNSAIKIQNFWRGYKQRQNFLLIRRSIVKIQAQIRMKYAMHSYHNELAQRKNAAIMIQKTWKGAIQRASYFRTLSYIIDLQSWSRMILAKRKYQQLLDRRTKAATLIQSHVRKFLTKKLMEKVKHEKAAIVLQKNWRSFSARKKFSVYKNGIVILQSFVRGFLARKMFKSEMEKKSAAAIKIQSFFRMCQAKKRFVQWKNKLEAERLSVEIRENNAALILQQAFKGWEDRFYFLKQKRAATIIKAAWRGRKARMALKKAVIAIKLEVVQRRVSEAHKNATEEQKLCNRTAFALDYLFTYTDVSKLIEALNTLNVSLRYSTNCCSRMFEEDGKAIQILINLLNGLNRSVPHIEVMCIIFDVFISLAEYHDTRPKLAKMEIVYDAVLTAMTKGEKDNKLFGMGCSLFWRLALFDEKRNSNIYLKDENVFKKLTEFEDTQKRKRKAPSSSMLRTMKTGKAPQTKSLSVKHGCQLTEKIVRFHQDPYLAITALMKKLKKQN